MKKLYLIFFLLCALISTNIFSQITVTTGQTANQLAQKLVGSGITISGATLISTATQCGKFTATANAFPFTDGIVLTSGVAKTNGSTRGVNGPNQPSVVDNPLGTAGDTWLDLLMPPPQPGNSPTTTQDACVLEFDLIPNGDSIFFNYIFSSEEYNGFVCNKYNDVFGFKLSGFGIIGYKNIALVPNQSTNIPVSVNSVNNGIPSSGNPLDYQNNCQATGVGAPFPAYYHDNTGNAYMAHKGRTVVLTAKAKVTRCKKYHLKIAIADAGDDRYDSGVFLEAGSLKSTAPASLSITNAYIDTNKQTLVERCHPLGYVKVNRNIKVDTTTALTLNFTYAGTATYGVDYTATNTITFPAYKTVDSFAINVIDDGVGDDNETILIKMQQAGCTSGFADSIPLKIIEHWTTTINSNVASCSGAGAALKSLYGDSTSTTFLWSNGDTSAITHPNSSGQYTCVATNKTTCYEKDTFNVVIDNFKVTNIPKNYTTCSTDSVVLTYTANQPSTSHTWSTGNSVDSIIKVNTTGNYVMTCISQSGCVASDTSFIKYIGNPVLTLPPTATFCSGDSVLLTASTDLGLKYLWSNGDTTNAIWVKNSGTYSVIAQANGCTANDTIVVTAKPNPVVNLPENVAKCKGDTVWLNASTLTGSVYTWNNGANTDSIAVTTSGQYIVDVNLNGCYAHDTSNVILYNIPVLTLPATVNFCAGDSALLNATTFAGTSYLWSTNDTASSIIVKTNGTYFVKATLGVCSAYNTTVVSVTQFPILNLPINVSSCAGDSVLLDATNPTGTIYTWSSGESTPKIWIKKTNIYIVTASLNGCATNDTTVAIFNKTPILNLPSIVNICAGDSALLNATTYAGTSYLWNTNDTTSSIVVKANGTYFVKATLGVCNAYDTTIVSVTQYQPLNLPATISACKGGSFLLNATSATGTIYSWSNGANTPTILIKNTGTYIVKVDLNGCSTRDTTIAVFNNTPILNLPATKNICAGDSTILNATSFAGTSYLWNTNETTPTITVKTNGTYSVVATLGVCSAYDTTVVSVTQYPTLNLQTSVSSCLGDSVMLDATNPVGTIYHWNNGATTPILWIKNSGNYIVTASLNGCSTKDTTVAIFNKTPILNLPKSKNICEGDSALLNATSYVGTNYLWSTGETTPFIYAKNNNIYLVKATLGVCTAYDSTILNVTQYQKLNLPPIVISCVGDSVLLDATSVAGTVYSWSNGLTTSTVWVNTPGSYRVTASINGCPTKDTSTVIFNLPPIVSVQPPTAFFCDGDSVLLTATSSSPSSHFLWNTNDPTNTLLVKVSGEYLVDVKADGCTTRGKAVVTVYPIPTVDAGKDLFIPQTNNQTSFKAIASSDVVSFLWTPSFNLSDSTALQPTILNPADTVYKLVVSNGHCTNFDSVKVIVLGNFKIPNVFSPNGDGINDTWEIKGLGNYPNVEVHIFDRYGRVVFTQGNYHKAWDGTYEGMGKPVAVGTYYYIIDAKQGRPVLSGSITVLR